MKDNRIFKACEVDCNEIGWIVDLSLGDNTNSDCHWRFSTKEECEKFVALIDNGYDAVIAYYMTNPYIVL
jgi:predicted RNase H-like nuclease